MKLYINGMSCISPQHTYDNQVFLKEVKEYMVNRLSCIEPDYAGLFADAAARRMGRLMKYGSASGLMALKDAGIITPGAISTGSALGLPEISQKFLRHVIESDETTVSPTAFIQSTHNTISSNIALLTKCHAHNNTFSNRGFSFESALTDARLIAAENLDNILVGAYDEISDYKYAAMLVAKELRNEPCSSLNILKQKSEGVIAGEGAAFFVLSKQRNDNSYGTLVNNSTFYKPDGKEDIVRRILTFLKENNIGLKNLDTVISGVSGDNISDRIADELNAELFSEQTIVAYKHLCGEYMTSSAFAFWLAAQMMKTQQIPEVVILKNQNRRPRNILFYNCYLGYHSLMLFAHV
ncbi:MAG: beta-ketoacyl synthase chain length factor [Bacteroidetes bacterium]|nr:beta-ketoacyl synthase chain length factor [Bacteroidota bacterium]